MEITERQKAILFAIIEEYSEMAAPVGSVTLAKLFNVSSATIRAEMARLEDAGLIAQPHTSAGRIPTDAGYRLYVNNLTEEADRHMDDDPNQLLGLPEYATHYNPDVKLNQAARARLGYGSNIDKINGESVNRGVHALEVRISSQERADFAIRGAVDMLVQLTDNLGLATIGDQLYLSGISNLFSQPEFSDASRIQGVAKLLDNLEPWLREAQPGKPLNIFIGNENPIGKTSGVSLIISKFRSPYSDNSYIGVLGPTRQNYAHAMNLVRHAGMLLEDILA